MRIFLLLFTLLFTTQSFAIDNDKGYPSLVAQPEISQFGLLVKEAGLAEFFQAPGPFTLFAPSNEAIAKMDQNKLKEMRTPAHSDELIDFINYHVVMGKYPSSTIKTRAYRTVNGKNIDVVVDGETIKVNGAKVIKSDISGPNGVAYIIDQVLMPK